jgi:hypothetical protein
MSAAAIANCAAGSKGVGPGVNSRVLRNIGILLQSGTNGDWCTTAIAPTENTTAHASNHGPAEILTKWNWYTKISFTFAGGKSIGRYS